MSINKKLYPIILLVIGIVFFFIYIMSYPRPVSIDRINIIEPGNNLILFFINNHLETGTYKYPIPSYGDLPENITRAFTPRDAAQFNSYLVPKYYLGIFVGYSTIAAINRDILLILTPLITIIAILFFYILTKKFFDEKIGLMASLLAFSIPAIWINGLQIFRYDIVSLFFLILGFFYFIQFSEKRNSKYYILSTIFLVTSILYQYTYIIYILPLVLYYIFLIPEIKRKNSLIIVAGIAAFFLIPILLLNNELYGNFLRTGYQMELINVEEALGSSEGSFLIFRPDFIIKYISMYLIDFLPLLSFGILIGVSALYRNKYETKIKLYGSYFLYIITLTIVIFGSHSSWGLNEYTANAAFLRYLLPAYLLSLPIFVNQILKLNKRSAISLFSIFIITCFVTTLTYSEGIIDNNNKIQLMSKSHDLVTSNTEINSVIITIYSDKYLFPDRKTLTAAYLGATNKNIDTKKFRLWEFPLDYEIIGKKASYLANKNISVYILDISDKDLEQPLRKNGYMLQDMRIERIYLYKLVKI